jgi:molecular chaperone DnaK (HSP70)
MSAYVRSTPFQFLLTFLLFSGLDKKQSQQAPGGPNNANRDPEQLTKDYLAALRNHLIYTLEQKLGAAFRTIPLEFVLTVPAIWSEVAKEKTLRACQAAGFRAGVPISLVSEPVK